MARPIQYETKAEIVAALKKVDSLSRYHKVQLVNSGFLKVVSFKYGRGRPFHEYVHTNKAWKLREEFGIQS